MENKSDFLKYLLNKIDEFGLGGRVLSRGLQKAKPIDSLNSFGRVTVVSVFLQFLTNAFSLQR